MDVDLTKRLETVLSPVIFQQDFTPYLHTKAKNILLLLDTSVIQSMDCLTVSIEFSSGRSTLTTKFMVAENFPYSIHFMHTGHLVAHQDTNASKLRFMYLYFHRPSTKENLTDDKHFRIKVSTKLEFCFYDSI